MIQASYFQRSGSIEVNSPHCKKSNPQPPTKFPASNCTSSGVLLPGFKIPSAFYQLPCIQCRWRTGLGSLHFLRICLHFFWLGIVSLSPKVACFRWRHMPALLEPTKQTKRYTTPKWIIYIFSGTRFSGCLVFSLDCVSAKFDWVNVYNLRAQELRNELCKRRGGVSTTFIFSVVGANVE